MALGVVYHADGNHATTAKQLLQRLVLGHTWHTDEAQTDLLTQGLGGLIFFKHDFDPLPAGAEGLGLIRQRNAHLRQHAQADANLPLWLCLDQEGGQVERLRGQHFPSIPSPLALAQAGLVGEAYELVAKHLALLGFNVNFAPSLDVNLSHTNPIIGVRAFGDEAGKVIVAARQAVASHLAQGVLPVGKHFPGHGWGEVDSHEALPTLHANAAEAATFATLINEGLPAVMIAHGHYPALQKRKLPATLDEQLATVRLTYSPDFDGMGFTGVRFSDDMCMGAITQRNDPVSDALLALNAGCDVLIYRDTAHTMAELLKELTRAIALDGLDEQQHTEALKRIAWAKTEAVTAKPTLPLTSEVAPSLLQAWYQQGQTQAEALATQAVQHALAQAPAVGQWCRQHHPAEQAWLWLVPTPESIPHYANECDPKAFGNALADANLGHHTVVSYPAHQLSTPEATQTWLAEQLATQVAHRPTVVLTWLPRTGGQLLATLGQQAAQTTLHVALGWPNPLTQSTPLPTLALASGRNPMLKALLKAVSP
jgi:beta-glucosidase-like glycosyl hydrolase